MHEREKWNGSRSVVSNSSRPHGLQPTRLLHPWDFPGKSTGVGCHCLLQYRGTTASKLEDLLVGICGTSLLLLLCQWNKWDHQWRERAGKRGLCRGVRCEIIIRITMLALNSIYCVPHIIWGFPCGSAGRESACNAGDLGSIPGLGRFPGEGKGYPLLYSGLENSMDCIVYGVAKSQTWLSNFHFHILFYVPYIY